MTDKKTKRYNVCDGYIDLKTHIIVELYLYADTHKCRNGGKKYAGSTLIDSYTTQPHLHDLAWSDPSP